MDERPKAVFEAGRSEIDRRRMIIMNSVREKEAQRCSNCGDPVHAAQNRIQDFQSEMAEEIYCPTCGHQKHFGVIQSE